MKNFSSKERVLAAFNHSEPDRIPRHYFGNPKINEKMMRHFNAKNIPELEEVLNVDIKGIWPKYRGKTLHEKIDGFRIDPIWGVRTKYVSYGESGYWDCCNFPLSLGDEEASASWPMPSADDYDYESMINEANEYKHKAIHVGDIGTADIMNSTGSFYGMEDMFVGLISDDSAMLRFIDRRIEITLGIVERMLDTLKGKVDFLWIGEDLGTQNAPLISLELFRKHIRPRLQKYVDAAKAYNLPVMIHSCGSSSWAFNDFIEMGIDVVDTLQPETKDMSPAYLKETYGDKLAFHGCISTAALASKDEEGVYKMCEETMAIMKKGGGYCFAPTHHIQDDTPVENVVEAYKCLDEKGIY